MAYKDITGLRSGKLVAISVNGVVKGRYHWNCKCDCGNYTVIEGTKLRSCKTKSCGCLHSQVMTIHGMHSTPEYNAWVKMKRRCINEKDRAYHRYGGRGIIVCKSWMKFENFYEDMGDRPTKKHQIDRRDNNGDYEPGNCRWVKNKQNSQNTTVSKRWVINGIMYLSLNEASKFCGVHSIAIKNWCDGKKVKDRCYLPKKGCYSYNAYSRFSGINTHD